MRKTPTMQMGAGGHTAILGATRVAVTCADGAAAVMKRAAAARAVEATAMNSASSRSHCVFVLYVDGQHAASKTHLTGSLSLVDLAGR